MDKRLIGIIGMVLMILSSVAMAEEDVPIVFTVGDYGKFTVRNIGTDPIYVLDKMSIIDDEKNAVHVIQDFYDTTVLKIYPGKSYSWELNDEIDGGDYKGKVYWSDSKNILTAIHTEEFIVDRNDEKLIIPTFTIPKPTFTIPKPTFTIPKPTPTTPKPTFTTPKPTFTTPKPTFTTPKPTFTTPKPTPAGIAYVKFYTDKTIYNRGKEVELIMKNIGTIPVYVHIPNQLEDPWIVKKIGLGEIVHIDTGCDSGYGYGLSCGHITLGPGEKLSYVWDQKNDNGVQVPTGTYKAYARYTKDNPDTVANPGMVTKTTTFLIRR